ncbi:MAG: type II secretion system protein GspL, partial [Acidiferrobacterales bacterium]
MTTDAIGSERIGTKPIIRAAMNAPVKNSALSFRTPERGMLSLRLPAGWPEDGLPVLWWWRAGDGETRHGQVAQLAELPAELRVAHVWVWTPAAETMLAQITLPTSSRARIAQALPYALEDQLLGEPESLHFAYRVQGGGSLIVGVTARTRLQAWIDALKTSGLEPAVLCPAILALPWDDKGWSLTPDGGELIVRTGPWSGFTCDLPRGTEIPEALAIAVREAHASVSAPESLAFYNAPETVDPGRWSEVLKLPVHRLEKEFWAQPPGASGFSLLQREFSAVDPLRQLL